MALRLEYSLRRPRLQICITLASGRNNRMQNSILGECWSSEEENHDNTINHYYYEDIIPCSDLLDLILKSKKIDIFNDKNNKYFKVLCAIEDRMCGGTISKEWMEALADITEDHEVEKFARLSKLLREIIKTFRVTEYHIAFTADEKHFGNYDPYSALDNRLKYSHQGAQTSRKSVPKDWEVRVDVSGRPYWVDHQNKTTHWRLP